MIFENNNRFLYLPKKKSQAFHAWVIKQ